MSSVVQVLRSNVGLSIPELESRIRTLFPKNNCSGILQKENIIIRGQPMVIRRLFIQTMDSGEYGNVGWVLNADLENCMICAQEFSVFLTKQHCYGCGNLVCSICSNEEGIVYELEEMGPLRVCNQCYWGQEPIYARYTRLEDSMLEDATRRWSSDQPSPVPQSLVVSTSHSEKKTKVTFFQQSTSDDEDEEEDLDQRRQYQKMLIRKSTEEPVTHIPIFSQSKPSEETDDLPPISKIPFIKRESGGNTTTLVDLFPFRDETTPQLESDHSDLEDSSSLVELSQPTSPPSSWSAATIFSSLMNSKPSSAVQESVESSNPVPVAMATTPPPAIQPAETTTRLSASERLSSSSTTPQESSSVTVDMNGNGIKSSPTAIPVITSIVSETKEITEKSSSPSPHQERPSEPSSSATFSQTQIPNFESRPVSQRIPFSNAPPPSSSSTSSASPSATQPPPLAPVDPSLRPLPPVIPSPFTVLKTKRLTNNSKVFINVLTIPEIYFDTSSSSSSSSSSPHLVIHSLHHTEDKGGDSCDVYDVCASDVMIHSLMETQDISEKYISMIQKINLDYQETLEIDYKTPKIKGNYKGNQEEEIKPYHCPNKLVSIAEIQKDPKLFYLFNESSLLPSGGGLGMETEPLGGQGQGGQGGVGVRPISKKMNPSSSGGAGAGNGSVASSSSSSSSPPPEMMRGWMKKQGHQFKTIKRRYFVLENGELKYYEKPLAGPPYGEKLKGSFPLKDGTVEFGAGDGKPLGKDGNQRLYIQALGNDMKIECEDELDAAKWMQAMLQHIDYYGPRKSTYHRSPSL